MYIHGYSDIANFITQVEPWLVQREAEHNLLLGLLPRLATGDHSYEEPIYLSSIEKDGGVSGCAFRTPPFKLGITQLPKEAIGLLVDHVASFYPELPGVMGPEEEVTRFAELWSRKNTCSWSIGMHLRIHVLERVISPDSFPNGALRLASSDDLPFLIDWIEAFSQETGVMGRNSRNRAKELVRDTSIYIWEDGEPRSISAMTGRTPQGARVGYVYTPPPFRGNGFATITVASMCDLILRQGTRFCFLYTDLSNPTSNAIYARIGYKPVCDVVDATFSHNGGRPTT